MDFLFQLCNGNNPLVCEKYFHFQFLSILFSFSFSGEQSGDYRELNYVGGNSGIESHPNGSLIIAKVSEEHSGNFLCQASNGIGASLSKLIRLTVHGMLRLAGTEFCRH